MRSHPRLSRSAGRLLAPALFAALALGSARASVSIPFPFTASFEAGDGYGLGSLGSDPVWSFSPGLTVEVSDMSFDGSQSLAYIGGAWLNLLPDAQSVTGGYPVTWVDFYLRPVFSNLTELPASLDATSATATGFVRVGADGEVYAVDGDGHGGGDWVASGNRVALLDDRAADWLRVSYRIDYGQKRWDLFLNGKLVLIDLGFVDDSVSGFTRFSLRGDSATSTLLDYFYAGDVNPLFADSNNDGLPDSWLQAHGLTGEDAGRDADSDRDGLRNITEYLLGLNPSEPDTDGDGVYDGREVARGTDPVVPQSVVLGSLPYTDSFEADAPGAFLDGTRAWSVNLGHETAAPSVIAVPAGQADGQQSLSLAGRDLRLERQFVSAPGNPVVWIDFLADLSSRAVAAPQLSADSAASFYVDESTGQLMALDGSGAGGGGWQGVFELPTQLSGSASPSSQSAFHRYTLRLDYAAQTWSLWVDGVRRADGFGFANAVPYFSGLTIDHDSGRASGLDRLAITTDEPSALDTDGDGLINAEEVALGTNPELPDSDDDGILDKAELLIGTDPTVANGIAAQLVQDAAGNYGWQTQFSSAEGYAAGYIAGQLGWGAAGESLVTEEAGRLSATTADASIERTFGPCHVNRVWIRFRAKLAPGQLPTSAEVAGAVSGMFGYRSSNRLAIFDGSTAQWAEFTVAASASEWNDYVLYFDYVAKRWVLALNGVVVAKNLAFRDTAINHLARLRVLQEGSDTATEAKHSEIDDIIVSSVPFVGLDLDGDGVLDTEEKALGTDPFNPDHDLDGMPDGWEVEHGLDPLDGADALADGDHDGIPNVKEYALGLDPATADPSATGVLIAERWTAISGNRTASLTDSIKFPLLASERILLSVAEVPETLGDNYGLRIRGFLLPPVTGEYLFWIAGDDETSFWLSPNESPFDRVRTAWSESHTSLRAYETRPSQRSNPVRLVAGQRYYFEAFMKEGTGSDHLSLAWRVPHASRVPVPATNVASFGRLATDLDEDGLPDAWESAHGIDPTKGYGAHGAHRDIDGDGLTNLEEYQYGTHPGNAFTLGGAIGDRELVFGAGVDPSLPVFGATPVTVAAIAPQTAVGTNGAWLATTSGLEARSLRGAFDVALNVPVAGVYRLDLTAMDAYAANSSRTFELELEIDGLSVGRLFISASGTQSGLGRLYLPWLSSGAHTLKVIWHNGRPDSFLRVVSLAIVNPGDIDADEDGVFDWVESRLAKTFEFDPTPVETHVSPYTAEGASAFPAFVAASSVTLGEPPSEATSLTVNEGLTRRFFVHVPLDPEVATQLTVAEAGGLRTVTKDISWTPLNLLEVAASPLLVRSGDRLLVSAVDSALDPEDEVMVSLVKADATQETFALAADETLEIPFPVAGDCELWVARPGDSPALALVVKVRAVSLEPAPILMGSALREWRPTGLPPEAFLEKDSTVVLEEWLPAPLPRRFNLGVPAPQGGRLVARLGEDGPIAATAGFVPLRSYHAEKGKWDVVDTFPDGTQLWKGIIDLGGPVPANLVVTINVFKAGATFDDGTLTRTFTAADFDENGVATYLLLRAPDTAGSPCHTVKFYDGTTYLNFQN